MILNSLELFCKDCTLFGYVITNITEYQQTFSYSTIGPNTRTSPALSLIHSNQLFRSNMAVNTCAVLLGCDTV